MGSRIALVVLGGLLVVSLYWGYRETQEKNAVLLKAENQYQRAFYDLLAHLEGIERSLTVLRTSRDDGYSTAKLFELKEHADAARANLSRLPLTLLPASELEGFLGNVSRFAFLAATEGKSRDDGRAQRVEALACEARALREELETLGTNIAEHKIRWMDVEMALALSEARGNPVVDGLRKISDGLKGDPPFPDGSLPPLDGERLRMGLKEAARGNPVSESQAREIVAKAFGLTPSDVRHAEVHRVEDDVALFDVTIEPQNPRDGEAYTGEVLERGGEIVWLRHVRPLGAPRLTYEQGAVKAERDLYARGMRGFVLADGRMGDGFAVYRFVPVQGDVLLFPDAIRVWVALDDGAVVGLDRSSYLAFHRPRDIPAPKLTAEEARRAAENRGKLVDPPRLAITQDQAGREVLAYTFVVEDGGTPYRVFLNAFDGTEEHVELLGRPPEKG
ncbi:PepSY1/2 domain-containing protein [Brockia lithotrophica]|uniref:PepSY1/2 domain-containing protein n=1 Tax=Brockia lithotrophica TaxID=933949 RepID=UPI0014742834|nr:PepSY1/2 domain-containing protein [Brockia lithotrophica]